MSNISQIRVRIRPGWMDAGKLGDALNQPVIDRKGQAWMVVQWDTADDPDLFKVAGLEMRVEQWQAIPEVPQ